jgi:hypothetical protein
MRALILIAVLTLAGCASKEETAALNADIYDHCASDAVVHHLDPATQCGRNRNTYQPSFNERYRYFRDQQDQRTAAAQSSPANTQYQQCVAAMMGQPTRSGTYAEAESNAHLVCSGQVPYSALHQDGMRCQPDGSGAVVCTTQ